MRSQSEVGLASGLGSPVAEGKRRRVEGGEAPAVVVVAAPEVVGGSPAKRSGTVAAAPKFAQATPVRPSPLWQVSQATTPSPSPPRKFTPTVAPPAAPSPARAPTAAADLIMGVIRSEELAHPSPRRAAPERAAVLNPYESERAAVIPRIPRSRPRRAEAGTRRGVRAAVEEEKDKGKKKEEVSPLEALERSMPAGYRREESKRVKVAEEENKGHDEVGPAPVVRPVAVAPPAFAFRPAVAAPAAHAALAPAPASVSAPAPVSKAAPSKAAPAAEVLELSDSDEDGEGEDEEMEEEADEGEDEDEEEDEVDEEDDEGMDDGGDLDIEEADDDEEEAESEAEPAPAPALPKPLFSFGSAATATTTAPSPFKPFIPAALPPPVPAVPSAAAPSAPAPAFAFSAAATAPLDVKEQVRRMDKAKLARFAFDLTEEDEEKKAGEGDAKTRAAREMAKGASGTEVRRFAFVV